MKQNQEYNHAVRIDVRIIQTGISSGTNLAGSRCLLPSHEVKHCYSLLFIAS